jgi:hypothetical protein
MRIVLIAVALVVSLASACASEYSSDPQPVARTRVETPSLEERELVCHKGRKTLSLPSPAVEAHLRHGDRRGAC